jgi:hypothetical protein
MFHVSSNLSPCAYVCGCPVLCVVVPVLLLPMWASMFRTCPVLLLLVCLPTEACLLHVYYKPKLLLCRTCLLHWMLLFLFFNACLCLETFPLLILFPRLGCVMSVCLMLFFKAYPVPFRLMSVWLILGSVRPDDDDVKVVALNLPLVWYVTDSRDHWDVQVLLLLLVALLILIVYGSNPTTI